MPTLKEGLPLSDLDGLTVWHESRLEEEDIENIPNMATADIVDLMVNTRFPANRIIDWVDQAILLTQLGAAQGKQPRTRGARQALGRARHPDGKCAAQDRATTPRRRSESSPRCSGCPGPAQIENIASSVRTSSNLGLILRWRGLEKV